MHSHANEFAPKWQRKKNLHIFYKLHHESFVYCTSTHFTMDCTTHFFKRMVE